MSLYFFSSRRRHTRCYRDWSSDVCSSDLSTAGKQSSMRRASTMTRAPSAPWDRSCHMKPNRSCPGVPNRYSLRPSSMVMQPKSSATVVDVFAGIWPARSTPTATEVMAASVLNGRISEIADTAVVLPTPKPPAMTIFTGIGGRFAPDRGSADSFESTDYPLDQVRVLRELEARALDNEVPQRREVGHEHPGDADVQPEPGGHLGHGHRRRAQLHDVAMLERQVRVLRHAQVGHEDLRLDLQRLVHRLSSSGGEQVRPQRRKGVRVRRTGRVVQVTTHGEVRPRLAQRRLVDAVGFLEHHVSFRRSTSVPR